MTLQEANNNGEPCRLCGQTGKTSVSQKDRHGNALETVLCGGCGVISNCPIPNDEELATFYRQKYRKEYKGLSTPRMRQVWRNFQRENAHVLVNWEIYESRKNCLDLGSGSGEFMFLLSQLGIKCLGIEPDEDYSAYCRDRLGLDIRTQTLEETNFADGSFDFIRLSHVLEHMPDPVRSLKTLQRWLSDDGVLYLETPNIEAEAERKMRGSMFHFGHIFNFNPFTLRLAARLAGLEESPRCASRLGGTTGTFFVRSSANTSILAGAASNVARVKSAMEGHNRRVIPKPTNESAVNRLLRMVCLRLLEFFASRKFSSHLAIAEHFGGRIQAAIAIGGGGRERGDEAADEYG
jgi:2-polyprenyl-3-methyl-5-hydroxy-6-metoxy-1,4-benzoquinol methylase